MLPSSCLLSVCTSFAESQSWKSLLHRSSQNLGDLIAMHFTSGPEVSSSGTCNWKQKANGNCECSSCSFSGAHSRRRARLSRVRLLYDIPLQAQIHDSPLKYKHLHICHSFHGQNDQATIQEVWTSYKGAEGNPGLEQWQLAGKWRSPEIPTADYNKLLHDI